MSFFNDAQNEAFRTGEYICSECGVVMAFEDDMEEVLICPACNHSVDSDHYGFANEEEYNAQYPTEEEVLAREETEGSTGEKYSTIYGTER